jgi:hypothetical protein
MTSSRHDHLAHRIQSEYLEMPGLRLTREQAQRLWALDEATCRAILDILVDSRFLVRDADGRYKRAVEGSEPVKKTAKADLPARDRSSRAR